MKTILLTLAALLTATAASAVDFAKPEASPVITPAIDSCFEPVMSTLSPGTVLYWTQKVSGCYQVNDKGQPWDFEPADEAAVEEGVCEKEIL